MLSNGKYKTPVNDSLNKTPETRTARIAVLVSGGGTNLQAIIDAQESGLIKSGKIELVISNNADAYAIIRAKNAGIPSVVVSKKNCAFSYSENGRKIELGGGAFIEILGPAGYSGDNLNNYSVISKLRGSAARKAYCLALVEK